MGLNIVWSILTHVYARAKMSFGDIEVKSKGGIAKLIRTRGE